VNVDEATEVDIRLDIRDLPGEAAQDHAQEDHGNAPYIGFLGVVRVTREDLWCQIRIRTDNAGSFRWGLARIMEHSGRPKVDQFDDILLCHDAIIKLEIAMGQPHTMQVIYTVNDLAQYTIDFGS
jgi:hypothetical protein